MTTLLMRMLVPLLAALALASACDRKPATGAEPAPGAPGRDPWASRNAADPAEIPTETLVGAAKDGMQYLAAREAEANTARTRQLAKLDQQIAKIQQLLDAGKLDEAEIRLVDIHWTPIEPGTHGDDELLRQYDDKRAALTTFIQRKRSAPSR